MGVGFCDPDADERGETSRPKRPVKISELQEKALRDTRHVSRTGATTYFSSREHVKRFKALEEKARGADDEGFLFKQWMLYHIEKVQDANQKTMAFGMGNLLARMENEDRRLDWTDANRKRLLAQRMESAKDLMKAKITSRPVVSLDESIALLTEEMAKLVRQLGRQADLVHLSAPGQTEAESRALPGVRHTRVSHWETGDAGFAAHFRALWPNAGPEGPAERPE